MLRATLVLVSATIALFDAAAALAQFEPGGANEPSEINGPSWPSGPATPTSPPPDSTIATLAAVSENLMISEVMINPDASEFIEILNPSGSPVDLSNYYLSDNWFEPGAPSLPVGYHSLPTGTYVIGTVTDFLVRFPAGATIPAHGTLVIALDGAGLDGAFGAGTADYEILSTSAVVPDMVNVGGNAIAAGATFLHNASEFVVLFFWDGASDRVCDLDYVTWGANNPGTRVDKTGIAQDGPDSDAIASAYLADTPDAFQSAVTAPAAGSSVQRRWAMEGPQGFNGNGCVPGGPTRGSPSTWGRVKVRYR